MDTTVTWIHLSDLHYCPTRTGWDATRVLRALSKDLEELANDHDLRPDFLFFTGDAAYGHLPDDGLSIDEQFDAAAKFFARVRDLCGIEHENVFLVPGNHDVDRTRIDAGDTNWLDTRRQQYDRDAVHRMIQQGSANDRWRRIVGRLNGYRSFLERHGYQHLLGDPERLIYTQHRRVRGIDIGIAGLNSAWSSHGDDHGRLWLGGDWQLANLEAGLEGADFAVGLVHHPLRWFVSTEAPEVEPHFERLFDFHLHGHEHKAWVKPLDDGSARIAAGACYDHSDRANGYNLVQLDFESGKGEVWLRYYEKDTDSWQKRELRGKTDAHGIWHLDRLRFFRRSERRRTAAEVPTPEAERPTYTKVSALSAGSQRLVDQVFDTLANHPIVMLLAHEGRAERDVLVEILERAAARHGDGSTFHVTPPGDPEATLEQYFARLGRQCGFDDEIHNPTDWEDALDYRLGKGSGLFLMVSRFEKGSPEGRQRLGAVLRALFEQHGRSIEVVLSGGEHLAALKYQDGQHSVLNAARRLDWPDPTFGDVLAWQQRDFPGLDLEKAEIERLLGLCGRDRRLIRYCLDLLRQGRPLNESAELVDCDVLWQLFTTYRDHPESPRVCELLDRDDLGPAQRWLGDALLRRLRWSGALGVQGRRLVWRSELVREVGKRVLGCG